MTVNMTNININEIIDRYQKANNKIIFLDYDGTLVPFNKDPLAVFPDEDLLNILDKISSNKNTVLVLISGRDYEIFDKWFKGKPYQLICEHGVFIQNRKGEWDAQINEAVEWKYNIRNIFEEFISKFKGGFIEEKPFSLVLHYRACKEKHIDKHIDKVVNELRLYTENTSLTLLRGDMVVEVKPNNMNKGIAAKKYIGEKNFDFIMAIGDDITDEDMFRELPENSITCKVGDKDSIAKYRIKDVIETRELLRKMI